MSYWTSVYKEFGEIYIIVEWIRFSYCIKISEMHFQEHTLVPSNVLLSSRRIQDHLNSEQTCSSTSSTELTCDLGASIPGFASAAGLPRQGPREPVGPRRTSTSNVGSFRITFCLVHAGVVNTPRWMNAYCQCCCLSRRGQQPCPQEHSLSDCCEPGTQELGTQQGESLRRNLTK